jgi:alpha-glucosidase
LLALALPGSVYVYQGEELGLPEVEDIEPHRIQDPMHFRSGGVDPGRDGARVPLPWSGTQPPYGFSPPGATAEPFLPQPGDWAGMTAEAQADDPASSLTLYREGLRIRRSDPDLHGRDLRWLDAPDPGVLAFARGIRFVCVVNLSDHPIDLPAHAQVLLTSGPLDGERLVRDSAAWLRLRD